MPPGPLCRQVLPGNHETYELRLPVMLRSGEAAVASTIILPDLMLLVQSIILAAARF